MGVVVVVRTAVVVTTGIVVTTVVVVTACSQQASKSAWTHGLAPQTRSPGLGFQPFGHTKVLQLAGPGGGSQQVCKSLLVHGLPAHDGSPGLLSQPPGHSKTLHFMCVDGTSVVDPGPSVVDPGDDPFSQQTSSSFCVQVVPAQKMSPGLATHPAGQLHALHGIRDCAVVPQGSPGFNVVSQGFASDRTLATIAAMRTERHLAIVGAAAATSLP